MKKSIFIMKKIVIFSFLLYFAVGVASAETYKDTLRVLCIGNSFTYVEDAYGKLQELASSQGHYINMNAQVQGGYTFRRHLRRDETWSAIVYYTYDHVFLQDQSRTPALYGENPRRCKVLCDDAKDLTDHIRAYSPAAHLWLEQTWSYTDGNCGGYGSLERFDAMLRKGTHKMAKAIHADVSPIGEAFIACRTAYPEIKLLSADNKHQSAAGAYLKACVNYILLYNTAFVPGVSDCDLDPTIAERLRCIAEQVVLSKK